MSVDPAHSLADSFDLGTALFHGKTGDPYPIDEKLAIHEVNIQNEIKKSWHQISSQLKHGRRKRFWCADVPYVMIVGPAMPTPMKFTSVFDGAPGQWGRRRQAIRIPASA